jgi:hypothetical protein
LIQNPPKIKNPNYRGDSHDFASWRREIRTPGCFHLNSFSRLSRNRDRLCVVK